MSTKPIKKKFIAKIAKKQEFCKILYKCTVLLFTKHSVYRAKLSVVHPSLARYYEKNFGFTNHGGRFVQSMSLTFKPNPVFARLQRALRKGLRLLKNNPIITSNLRVNFTKKEDTAF